MTTDELEGNWKESLEHTLLDLSSFERQSQYKTKVPFVHVPVELVEQWVGHMRMLREQDWYRALYSPEEQAAFARLDEAIELQGERFPETDVPEIFQDEAWLLVSNLARQVLDTIRRRT